MDQRKVSATDSSDQPAVADGNSPYWHGLPPFVVFKAKPWPGSWCATPLLLIHRSLFVEPQITALVKEGPKALILYETGDYGYQRDTIRIYMCERKDEESLCVGEMR